ncbi:MAG: YidC/Oxa1 family insertase periplasmic-domain containing protein [Verrucomicrobiaceae bacterium]|nr:YidC/Oxa1 family insertase periplasmic-domain containing protein [Verrucomicrobiaceae bacterium]
MDRKGWIVITLCIILMGVNFHYMQENAKMAQQQAEEAKKKADEAKKAAPAAADGGAAATPAAGQPSPAATVTAPSAPVAPEQKHQITAGSVTYHFTTKGGGIERAVLAGTDHVTLNEHSQEAIGALRREAGGLDGIAYTMKEATAKGVTFEGTNTEGIRVTKAWSLTEGAESDEHLLDLKITLTNTGTAQHRSEEYYLFAGASTALNHADDRYQGFFWNNGGSAKYEWSSYLAGGTFSSAKPDYRQSFDKLRFGGVMSRFYTHILTRVNERDAPGKLWTTRRQLPKPLDPAKAGDATIQDFATEAAMSLPTVDLAAGASVTEHYQVYLGPKEYDRLSKIGKQRHFAMYYGWFSIVSTALVVVMRWMHEMTGNWGVAVILLTIFVRLCIWPVHAKSMRTMKRMSLLGPMMKELQEKYKDNPQQQQMEVMKLYRDYGVNPLGGCLPLLLQFPIFIGLYSMLEYAAELRGHGLWWVRDLSAPDTVATLGGFNINPLPIIMGLTMVAQMKLTPQPQTVDKMQQRIFMFMPLIFLWFSYDFASALSLYWSTQNLFSIAQTWIMKLYVPEPRLEKVKREPKPVPQSAFFQQAGQKDKSKDKKNKPPRLGG